MSARAYLKAGGKVLPSDSIPLEISAHVVPTPSNETIQREVGQWRVDELKAETNGFFRTDEERWDIPLKYESAAAYDTTYSLTRRMHTTLLPTAYRLKREREKFLRSVQRSTAMFPERDPSSTSSSAGSHQCAASSSSSNLGSSDGAGASRMEGGGSDDMDGRNGQHDEGDNGSGGNSREGGDGSGGSGRVGVDLGNYRMDDEKMNARSTNGTGKAPNQEQCDMESMDCEEYTIDALARYEREVQEYREKMMQALSYDMNDFGYEETLNDDEHQEHQAELLVKAEQGDPAAKFVVLMQVNSVLGKRLRGAYGDGTEQLEGDDDAEAAMMCSDDDSSATDDDDDDEEDEENTSSVGKQSNSNNSNTNSNSNNGSNGSRAITVSVGT